MFEKKLVKNISKLYEGRYVVINSELPALRGRVGKVVDVFLNDAEELMTRIQLSPGPFVYDGVEKLKARSHIECLPMDNVKLVDSAIEEKPKMYTVTEEWCVADAMGQDIHIFSSREKADIFKQYKIFAESDRDGLIYLLKMTAWKDGKDVETLHSDYIYICGIKDSAPRKYYKIKVAEVPIG